LVTDLAGKSRGYAFVTFTRERDADYAISKADGRRVDGKRILVDRELGRTKMTWVPRRLGGGKGGETRRADTDYLVEEVLREIKKE
jgi:U1 small nuclear ribonucleoprotein 70kDa